MSRKVVVTGASSEIGIAIARRLLEPDDEAVLQCHRHPGALTEFQGRAGVQIVPCDLSNREDVDRFCLMVAGCDVLVNAAAATIPELLPNLSDTDIDAMIAVNIAAFTRLCRSAVVPMMRRRSGAIVNISSVAAQRGNRGQSVYGGTKAYVEAFSRSLSAEFAARGVRVNCVAPGAIEAGSLRTLLADAHDEVKGATAAQRLGTPADVAEAVAFLASPAANFIHGQVLRVDGAFLKGVG